MLFLPGQCLRFSDIVPHEYFALDVLQGFFAYPFGHYNKALKELVRQAGYKAAFKVNLSRDGEKDLYSIGRLEITGKDEKLAHFALKVI